MKRKKFTALILATVLSLSSLAACQGNTADTTAAKSSAAGNSTSAPGTSAEGTVGSFTDYTGGFPEKVTLEIPVYDRAFEGWNVTDNYWTRWIQKEFGDKYNVEVKYVAIGRSTEVNDFQQLLASHKAPDVIFHYDMPQALTYFGEGVMQPLNWDEISFYAPTFWQYSGDQMEKYGTINGENAFFFATRPAADNFTTLIRKDWVEKAGYKMEDLTSQEKFNEMLMKWKEMNLGVLGASLIRNFFVYNYPFRSWPVEEKERALYSDLSVADFTTPATEAFLKNMNYQYNQGIVDREFYLRDDDAKWKAEFVSGKVGTFNLYLASNTDVIDALVANNPEAELAVLPPEALVPEGNKPQSRAYWPFGMIMGVNYESTDMERAALWMFLEWMSQPENLFMLQNGIEGQNYNLNDKGVPIKVADFKGESALSPNNNKDYWCLVTEGLRYENEEIFWEANRLAWSPPGYESLVDDLIRYYKDTEDYRTPDALFKVQIESVAEYKADLNTLWQELYVKCVTCPESDFAATYEAAKEQFLSAGYQSILDEKQIAIDAGEYVF